VTGGWAATDTLREKIALRIAPWLYVPYREDREEAFKDLAEVAYGSREAVWMSLSRLREQRDFNIRQGAYLNDQRRAAEARCARLQQALEEREDERLQLRAAFYRLQDQLERAYGCCARPSGTCFDPEVLTTSVPGSSASDVDGSEKRVSAARGHHESVGERQGRQPGTEALAGPDTPAIPPRPPIQPPGHQREMADTPADSQEGKT
jgi:hypothetical protein